VAGQPPDARAEHRLPQALRSTHHHVALLVGGSRMTWCDLRSPAPSIAPVGPDDRFFRRATPRPAGPSTIGRFRQKLGQLSAGRGTPLAMRTPLRLLEIKH